MQHSASVETLIEFTHRLTSGLSLFSVVGLLVWTYRATARGHLARAAAVASVAFTLVEAILGALLVKLGLTAQSQSPLRPAYLALHLTNTLLLLAALTLTAHYAEPAQRIHAREHSPGCAVWRDCRRCGGDDCGRDGFAGGAGRYAVSGQFAGAGAGAGFSGGQRLAGALALDASDGRVCFQHFSDLDSGASGAASAHWDNRGLSALVLVLLAAQYVLGVLDVFLLAPLWLQVAHLLGADVLWVALVVLTARLTLVPEEQRSEIRGQGSEVV
jgi:cytochrome c oxidase assembly protein subunit 15